MERQFRSMSCLLFLFAVFLAACGGASGATRVKMVARPVLASKMGQSIGRSMPSTVRVMETEFAITSSITTFVPGTTYHFVVTNTGKMAHEFMVMPKPEGAMADMSMAGMDRLALVRLENLFPGETRTVDYIFPASAAGSHPEFVCYLPGHYGAGMKLDITVRK